MKKDSEDRNAARAAQRAADRKMLRAQLEAKEITPQEAENAELVNILVRCPAEIHAALVKLAADSDRSLNRYVIHVLKRHLESTK